jgi:threonine/homoserine/homoserine lactone efflux protein
MGNVVAFLAASLVLLVLPGPAVLFVVTRSVQHGRTAGLVSVLGLSLGGLVHVLAAVLGLSALLASSTAAFTSVQVLGAGYLVYLGVRTLAGKGAPPAIGGASPEPLRRLFLDGVAVNVLNPKTAIFFLAFLPQFVAPERGGLERQLATLGLAFVALALLTDGAYTLAAAALRGWLAKRPRIWKAQRYVAGAVYLGLGLSAALTGRRTR